MSVILTTSDTIHRSPSYAYSPTSSRIEIFIACLSHVPQFHCRCRRMRIETHSCRKQPFGTTWKIDFTQILIHREVLEDFLHGRQPLSLLYLQLLIQETILSMMCLRKFRLFWCLHFKVSCTLARKVCLKLMWLYIYLYLYGYILDR